MPITNYQLPITVYLFALLTSCTTPPPAHESTPLTSSQNPAPLLNLLANTSTPDASRKAADQRLIASTSKTDPSRLAILEQLLYAPGHSDAMRIYALDQLADAEPARCANALLLYLPRMTGAVLDHACKTATALGDPRLIDPLTRSLARGTDNPAARPELPALQSLSGKSPHDTLMSVLANSDNTTTQIAALTALENIEGPGLQIFIDWLRPAPGSPPNEFLADLQWWTATFAALPVGENECRWIQILHRPENAPLVNRAIARHKLLSKQPDYTPAPRFIATLAYIDDAALALSRDQLLADLHTALDHLPHVHRPPQYQNAPDDLPDTLAANESKLSRADLLTLRLLLQTLPAALPTLYQQGLDDLADTSTEHGGLLALTNINNPALTATLYPPAFAENDLTYLTSDALLRDTPLGLAQYHFHFQQIHNEDRAGPGPGDLAYIRQARTNALVITSTNTRQVNLDFYTPAGALIDLGTHTLP